MKVNKSFNFNKLLKDIWNTRFLQLMMIPSLVYLVMFQYIPMYGVIIAFKNYRIGDGIWGSRWVGLEQFVKFFTNPFFPRLLKNTVLLNVYSLLIVFPIPIIFALLLNEVRPPSYKKIVQTVSYLPHFISLTAVIGILTMMLSPTTGIINRLIMNAGGSSVYFLAEPRWFRTLYILSVVWTGLGWGAIIYIAALSGVNAELYESAALDGASRVKQIIHISFPSILPTVTIMLLLEIGKMMSVSADRVILMQNAMNLETSDVFSTYVYRLGLEQAQYSYTAAVGMFNSVINIVLLTVANAVSSKISETSLW